MSDHSASNPFDVGYDAARSGAALFDFDDWTCLRASGRDAIKFMQNFCTNDIQKLPPGEGCEAFLTNVKARVLAHVLIYHQADGSLRLLTSPGQATAILAHLDRYIITEDVTISDETHARGLLGLAGPHGETILRDLGGDVPAAPQPHRFATLSTDIAGEPAEVSTFDGLGRTVYLIETSPDSIGSLAQRLVAAGATRAGLDVFNSLRVEAVYPWGGFDINEEHLAPEVDRPWAISLTKGCYLGQEPIARIDALGHVNRVLRGVRLEEEMVPGPESAVLGEGKVIGEVRSTATSGIDGKVIALAFVRTAYAKAGTKVTVQAGEMLSPAVVFGGG